MGSMIFNSTCPAFSFMHSSDTRTSPCWPGRCRLSPPLELLEVGGCCGQLERIGRKAYPEHPEGVPQVTGLVNKVEDKRDVPANPGNVQTDIDLVGRSHDGVQQRAERRTERSSWSAAVVIGEDVFDY